jgi:hypothetical protein
MKKKLMRNKRFFKDYPYAPRKAGDADNEDKV